MLALLARLFLIRRLMGRSRRRGRAGFFGPLPYYSTRTRGGSRVSVSGCCLPIPLFLTVALASAVRLLLRRP